jgi:hypothetical protein
MSSMAGAWVMMDVGSARASGAMKRRMLERNFMVTGRLGGRASVLSVTRDLLAYNYFCSVKYERSLYTILGTLAYRITTTGGLRKHTYT